MNSASLNTASGQAHKRKKRIFMALGVLVVVAFTVFQLTSNAAVTIAADRVYKSRALPEDDLRATVEQYGIKTVIDLREPPEEIAAERAALAGLDVNHINLPTPQVPTAETVDRFLEIMDKEETYPVLIHCEHGYGRAVLFSAIYRMEYEGWSNEDARAATRNPLRLPFSGFALEEPKGAFVNEYKRRHNEDEPEGAHGASQPD